MLTLPDKTGRFWTIATEPAVSGFLWTVYIHHADTPIDTLEALQPGGTANGWTEDWYSPANEFALLTAMMRVKGAEVGPALVAGARGLRESPRRATATGPDRPADRPCQHAIEHPEAQAMSTKSDPATNDTERRITPREWVEACPPGERREAESCGTRWVVDKRPTFAPSLAPSAQPFPAQHPHFAPTIPFVTYEAPLRYVPPREIICSATGGRVEPGTPGGGIAPCSDRETP